MKYNPEGLAVAQVRTKEDEDYINHYKQSLDILRQPEIHQGTALEVLQELDEDLKFEIITGRNVFTRLPEEEALLNAVSNRLHLGGTLRLCESIPSGGSTLSSFIKDQGVKTLLMKAEETIYHSRNNPMTAWDEKDVKPFFSRRFKYVDTQVKESREERLLDKATLTMWITKTYLPTLEKSGISSDTLLPKVLSELENRNVSWSHRFIFISAGQNPPEKPDDGREDEKWKDVLERTKAR